MNEIQPYRNDFVTERAEKLYFALNKLHYLEGLRMEGVQSVIKSLQGDLEEQGEGKLAEEIIVFDRKQRTSEVPQVFKEAFNGS